MLMWNVKNNVVSHPTQKVPITLPVDGRYVIVTSADSSLELECEDTQTSVRINVGPDFAHCAFRSNAARFLPPWIKHIYNRWNGSSEYNIEARHERLSRNVFRLDCSPGQLFFIGEANMHCDGHLLVLDFPDGDTEITGQSDGDRDFIYAQCVSGNYDHKIEVELSPDLGSRIYFRRLVN